jgi:uncharacterized protein YegP (UPF0339 family)
VGHYCLDREASGAFAFRLQGEDRRTLLESAGYPTRDAAIAGIVALRLHAANDERWDRILTEAGAYFVLRADGGWAIVRSCCYASGEALEEAIGRVKAAFNTAIILEGC